MSGSMSCFVSAMSVHSADRGLLYTSNDSPEHEGHRCHYSPQVSHRGVAHLNLDNVHKMIKRFLNEKGMSKEELAKILEITVKNLEQLFTNEIPSGLLSRVNLPLARLYCGTKWW